MSYSLTPTLTFAARILAVLALLLAPAVVATSGGALSAAEGGGLSEQISGALDTVNEKTAPGDAKMAPIMDETNKTASWIIWVLWLVGPLIILGSLISWGVMQAKKDGMAAAQNTFIAVGIGVIMWLSVFAIFF